MGKITWKSEMSFGKYEGISILAAWIKDKQYFKWCIEQEINRPEIDFVKYEMSESEKRILKLEY